LFVNPETWKCLRKNGRGKSFLSPARRKSELLIKKQARGYPPFLAWHRMVKFCCYIPHIARYCMFNIYGAFARLRASVCELVQTFGSL